MKLKLMSEIKLRKKILAQLKKSKPGVSEKNTKLNNLVLSTREYLPYFLKRKSVSRTLVSFFKISGNII